MVLKTTLTALMLPVFTGGAIAQTANTMPALAEGAGPMATIADVRWLAGWFLGRDRPGRRLRGSLGRAGRWRDDGHVPADDEREGHLLRVHEHARGGRLAGAEAEALQRRPDRMGREGALGHVPAGADDADRAVLRRPDLPQGG